MATPYSRKERSALFWGSIFLFICAIGSAWFGYSIIGVKAYFQYPRVIFWQPVPCEIVRSSFTSSRDECKVLVDYKYQFGGNEYTGINHQFPGVVSRYLKSGNRFCTDFPPGRQTVCYVNPANPSEAVLDKSCREWLPGMLSYTSWNLFLFICALFVLTETFRQYPRSIRLRIIGPGEMSVIICILCAIFSLGFFLWAIASYLPFRAGVLYSACSAAIICLGIGVCNMIRTTCHYLLAPPVRVYMEPGVAFYGDQLYFRWQIPQKTRWLELELNLVCTRSFSKNNKTDRDEHMRLKRSIAVWRPGEDNSGDFSYQLPAAKRDIPGHGAVEWFIEASGRTRRKPKTYSRYVIHIYKKFN